MSPAAASWCELQGRLSCALMTRAVCEGATQSGSEPQMLRGNTDTKVHQQIIVKCVQLRMHRRAAAVEHRQAGRRQFGPGKSTPHNRIATERRSSLRSTPHRNAYQFTIRNFQPCQAACTELDNATARECQAPSSQPTVGSRRPGSLQGEEHGAQLGAHAAQVRHHIRGHLLQRGPGHGGRGLKCTTG